MGHIAQTSSNEKARMIISFILIKGSKTHYLFFLELNVIYKTYKLNSLHPRMLCAKLVVIGHVRLEIEDFKSSSTYFRYFVIISPWEMVWLFI